ncbi:MAG: EAL domain-containing protein [Treponema sp.]|jgi:EAL domain-containing protein (putative c-di-GMP-specific phosphodiesterase class I)|nr:EAL domain-containing protein [Treponema sp.]
MMDFSPDNIIAYFQPILSADSNKIYSYEVLGRYIDNDGTVKSLGAFFNDENTTDEEALKADRIVRKYALRKYAEEKRNEYLFINIRLAWLEKFKDRPEELPTIIWMREFGIDPDRIVIEITEQEFNASDAQINVLSYYKNAGFRIALDDYGKNASNIERLSLLQPDIIKIDIDYIHKSEESYHYREYLRMLASFAEAVGIEVLYEGIETQRQLDICMSSRGRFYQGFLFALPQASMRDAIVNHHVFSASGKDAYEVLQKRIMYADLLKSYLDSKIGVFLIDNPLFYEKDNINEYLSKLCGELPEVVRIYLCNKLGEQITYNFEWNSENVTLRDYRGKNWTWRGFFSEALEALIEGKKSCLSTVYRDFTTKKRIYTYFYALDSNIFLFADINRIPLPFRQEAL